MANEKMWFGTADYMQWIDPPLSGAEMSPEGWSAGGTSINGGGWGVNSFGSHKTYTFEWSDASAIEAAMLMKSYADGTYGRGLIYFLDPLSYGRNVLPARLASPGMAVGYEGGTLVYGVTPTAQLNTGWAENGFPKYAARYDLAAVGTGFRGPEEATFIPIPPGYTLMLGAYYASTGTGGIYINRQLADGTISATAEKLTAISIGVTNKVSSMSISGVPGIWIWAGRTTFEASVVTARAMIARLIPTADVSKTAVVTKLRNAPWVGGMGHSGCRFEGKPTYIANNGVNGGQAGYAASFREVGSWLYG